MYFVKIPPIKEEIVYLVDTGLLLHATLGKFLNYLKAKREIVHMKATLWTIRVNSKRYRGKNNSKNIHMKLCTRFCIKSKLVRFHEYLSALWLQHSAFIKSAWGFSKSEPQTVWMILCNINLLNLLSLFFSPIFR